MNVIERVLAATDFSEAGDHAVAWAAALAADVGATLVIAHAFDAVATMPTELVQPRRAHDRAALASAEEARARGVEARLAALAARLPRRPPLVELRALHGDARTELARLALKSEVDLIVVGRSGRSGLRRLFLGSTTERTLRAAPTPVLVVPAPPRAVAATGVGAGAGDAAGSPHDLEHPPLRPLAPAADRGR